MLATGFGRADPIATLVVVGLMLQAGAGLIRASGRIFLEAAPAGLDLGALGAAMAARPYVAEVHDLHVWEITSGMPAASAHVLVTRGKTAMRCGPTWRRARPGVRDHARDAAGRSRARRTGARARGRDVG